MDRAGNGIDRREPVYRFPLHLFFILALLLGGLLVVSMARAGESPCGDVYIASEGDNLNLIALECETSVPALIAANPGVSQQDTLSPGQMIQIPGTDTIPDTGATAVSTSTTTYTVVSGDTLSSIAARYNTTVALIQQANPQITNPNLIYPGQVLAIPGSTGATPPEIVIPDTGAAEVLYTVRSGDTLSGIARRYGTTTAAITQRNPDLSNPGLIYPGQSLVIPTASALPGTGSDAIPDTGAGEVLYTVRSGDTLSEIARQYGIPTTNLITRNAQIDNPDLIYPGQTVVIPGTLPPATAIPPTTTLFPPTPVSPTPLPPTPQPTPAVPVVPPPDVIPDTGEILFQDDFSTTGDWLTSIEPGFQMEYAEGGYRIVNHTANTSVSSVRALGVRDVYVETRAARVGGPQTGYYGVVCRWQDIQNYYAMVIGSDGFYSIVRISNGQLTYLSDGRTTAGPILLDNASNTIAGSCIGDTLTLIVNGERLLAVQDQTFAAGDVGLMVATRAASGTHVHFNYFKALQ